MTKRNAGTHLGTFTVLPSFQLKEESVGVHVKRRQTMVRSGEATWHFSVNWAACWDFAASAACDMETAAVKEAFLTKCSKNSPRHLRLDVGLLQCKLGLAQCGPTPCSVSLSHHAVSLRQLLLSLLCSDFHLCRDRLCLRLQPSPKMEQQRQHHTMKLPLPSARPIFAWHPRQLLLLEASPPAAPQLTCRSLISQSQARRPALLRASRLFLPCMWRICFEL